MKGVDIFFKFLDEESTPPTGHKRINCHIIFYVNIYLTRKVRFVVSGRLIDPPTSMTYDHVLSYESVRITLLLATLNQ